MPIPKPEPRPPSPVFPGAWPRNPLRNDSQSCRIPGNDTDHAFAADPSLPVSVSSSETLGFDGLTSTRLGNSASTLVNFSSATSQTSTSSTPKHDDQGIPSNKSGHPARIYQLPSPESSSDRAVKIEKEKYTTTPLSQHSKSSGSSTPSSPASLEHSQCSNSTSAISALVFASPTSSNRTPPAIRRSRAARNDSYDYSSLITSEEGEYDDSNLLRTGTPSATPSLSPSPFPSPASARQVVIVSPMSGSYASSISDLQVPQEPLLTCLSLPGSLDGEIDNLDAHPSSSRVIPGISRLPGDSSSERPHSSPFTCISAPFAATSPVDSALSLTRSSSSPAGTENYTIQMVQSSSPFISSSSSPSPNAASESNKTTEPSPTEYATAVMMSAWGSSAPHLEPMDIEIAQTGNQNIGDGGGDGHTSDFWTQQRAGPEIPIQGAINFRGRSSVLLVRIKKIGHKVKTLLRARSKNKHDTRISLIGAGAEVEASRGACRAVTETQRPSVATRPGSGSSTSLNDNVPSPTSRIRRQRPCLTVQTYAPSVNPSSPLDTSICSSNHLSASAPPRPAPFSTQPSSFPQTSVSALYHQDNPLNGSTSNESPDLKMQLEAHSRPKTLAEIKSKRRFSLSALAGITSSSGPSTPIPITPPRRSRPRPASALILPSNARSRPEASRPRARASISYPINPVRVSAPYSPPGLDTPSSDRATWVSPRPLESPSRVLASRSCRNVQTHRASASSAPHRDTTTTHTSQNANTHVAPERKDGQGFVLSTLSSFAAGLRDQGSWARFNGRTGSKP